MPVSIQFRQALGKLVLPALILVACGVILLGKADRALVERLRMQTADLLAPAYSLVAWPQAKLRWLSGNLQDIRNLEAENIRLRAENESLRHWYDVAAALADENGTLKANLHWIPDNAPTFVSGRVVRDTSGLYARAVLLAINADTSVRKGGIALDGAGLVGRVTEVGKRSARVLLITDSSSRLPVTLESSHAAAIMAGDNSPLPRIIFYPQDNVPIEGERVVTNGEIESLPAGLPVGHVHYVRPGQPVVVPAAALDHVDILRIFDYADSVAPPDAPGRVPLPPPVGGTLSLPAQFQPHADQGLHG
ncbi:rod shape-determining protein MreC [Komagataeibacter rhaeticus]|uniref:Cell shape-determining protein MreC n=1 Tax=Komagataeibacter rhaeticus TaxID=215221 RepID=A0A181C7S4_9PROT|nr:rod shape-determining protein MreC [Komagataeibacter rhaeticus]ATU73616.1 rod shape-determining protein MreC [Komagataeibacter xylinus]EGG76243.1 rod shape-determining protein MreC [Gluconacetobacter sp. SXCC-1]KDU95259.1 rod shape-determining protein MreC [Komagataeibacter rhaeticus AF1]MBL7240906.1 rod shape-determining protein MreC [Komagataeibacter rhaeticus]PYD53945.1 rod shape-determining protein MreC [Komagataeibacter rhaeticus]